MSCLTTQDRSVNDTAITPKYLAQIKQRKSDTTYDRYKNPPRQPHRGELGQPLIRECNVGRLERYMNELGARACERTRGAGLRSVLPAMLAMAVR